ncbi:MAG: DUF2577 domain-containing protein [Oscillospiraceae bacterium]
MHNYADFNNLIKQSALEAMSASKPSELLFGMVTSTKPLQINVEQRMTLTSPQLVLTRNVTDFQVSMTMNHETDDSLADVDLSHDHTLTGNTGTGGSDNHTHSLTANTGVGGTNTLNHKHRYAGKKTFTMHNGLVVGDEVILARMQGGQKFIVLDRVVGI